jgi:hypothetical protein
VSRRADLKARIKKARAALAYVERCEADLAKTTAVLQKKKALLIGGAAALDGAFHKPMELAELSIATAAKSASVARASAIAVLEALKAELDALNEAKS